MNWLDNTVLIGLSLLVIGLIGLIFWRLTVKYKGATVGEIINVQLVKEKITFFIAGAFLANLAEAVMAASIHPMNEMAPNPFTRWLIHMTIGFAGIVCGVYSFHYVRQFASRKKKTTNNYILAAIIIGMLIAGSIGFPYLNLVIIAKGMGDLQLLLGFLKAPVVALEKMSFVTAGSLVAMLAHLGLVTLDGLLTADDIKFVEHLGEGDNKKKKDVHESINDKDKASKETKLDKIEDGIKYLLRRYGYKDTGNAKAKKDYKDVLEDAHRKIDTMDSRDQYILAENVWRLVNDIKEFDKSGKKGKSSEEIKAVNEEFRERIYKLWEKSTKGGKGFGRKLFQRKGN